MTTAKIVKASKVSRFVSYRNGVFLYQTDQGYTFEIPLSDIDGATLKAEDKTIFFMRWIRKQVEFSNNEAIDIEGLKDFASTIKHCGDYGDLYVDRFEQTVYWVASDADFEPDEVEAGLATGSEAIKEGFLKVKGIKKVRIECENSPEGVEHLGKFGIDNYEETSKYWDNKSY
jgi:hypothetical protein